MKNIGWPHKIPLKTLTDHTNLWLTHFPYYDQEKKQETNGITISCLWVWQYMVHSMICMSSQPVLILEEHVEAILQDSHLGFELIERKNAAVKSDYRGEFVGFGGNACQYVDYFVQVTNLTTTNSIIAVLPIAFTSQLATVSKQTTCRVCDQSRRRSRYSGNEVRKSEVGASVEVEVWKTISTCNKIHHLTSPNVSSLKQLIWRVYININWACDLIFSTKSFWPQIRRKWSRFSQPHFRTSLREPNQAKNHYISLLDLNDLDNQKSPIDSSPCPIRNRL